MNVWDYYASHHSALSVFCETRKETFGLYKPSEKTKPSDSKIKFEGIYFFGGLSNDDHVLKDLKILRIDCFPA